MTTAQSSVTRMPPHSEEAERSLLGAVLPEGDTLTEVMTLVSPEYFYVTAHQKIYASCEKLYGDGKRVDSTLILEDLRSNGELEKVGGEAYLAHLAALVPSAAGAVDVFLPSGRGFFPHGEVDLQRKCGAFLDLDRTIIVHY